MLVSSFVAQAVIAAPIKVVVWDEQQPAQKDAYPNFLGNQIASYLETVPNLSVKSVNLGDPEQALSDGVERPLVVRPVAHQDQPDGCRILLGRFGEDDQMQANWRDRDLEFSI